MPLTLRVDGLRWREHLRSVAAAYPDIVPVAKGNGYGFGLHRLARRAEWLPADTVAVGSYEEVPQVLSRFGGDVLVMEPWRAFLTAVSEDRRVIHTLGRVEDVRALADRQPRARVVVEGLTSMTRFGLAPADLRAAASALRRLRLRGLTLHLPLAGDRLSEADRWCAQLQSSGLPTTAVYVSHLDEGELASLRSRWPALTVRPRIGTALWLGNLTALRPAATVLDRHEVERGQRVGYRQRPLPAPGRLLVVAGGTSHGIGLQAPASGGSVRSRATALARGGLDAAGLALSPFTVGGKKRWFAEPPHMQVSMIFLPYNVAAPAIGAEVGAEVRYTTTTFDAVVVT